MKYIVATTAARTLPEVDRAQIEELVAPTSVDYDDLYRMRRGDEPGASLISQLNDEFGRMERAKATLGVWAWSEQLGYRTFAKDFQAKRKGKPEFRR